MTPRGGAPPPQFGHVRVRFIAGSARRGGILGARMGARLTGTLAAAALALAAASPAAAQGMPPPPSYGAQPQYGAPPAANQVCVRLESQPAMVDRGPHA